MPRVLTVILVALLLAACGGPNLTGVDLEPLLIQSGDLPAGTGGGQVRDGAPQMFAQAPAPTKAIYQQLARGSDQAGGVTVLLYAQPADREAAYTTTLDGMGDTYPVDGIGEQAVMSQPIDLLGLHGSDLLFRRCAAVVHVRFIDPNSPTDTLKAYGQRLDKRLQGVVC